MERKGKENNVAGTKIKEVNQPKKRKKKLSCVACGGNSIHNTYISSKKGTESSILGKMQYVLLCCFDEENVLNGCDIAHGKICRSCVHKVESFYRFKKQALRVIQNSPITHESLPCVESSFNVTETTPHKTLPSKSLLKQPVRRALFQNSNMKSSPLQNSIVHETSKFEKSCAENSRPRLVRIRPKPALQQLPRCHGERTDVSPSFVISSSKGTLLTIKEVKDTSEEVGSRSNNSTDSSLEKKEIRTAFEIQSRSVQPPAPTILDTLRQHGRIDQDHLTQLDNVIGNPVKPDEMKRIVSAMSNGTAANVAEEIFECPSIHTAVWEKVLQNISGQCSKLCQKQNKTYLADGNVEKLTNFQWDKIITEMQMKCPELLDVMLAVAMPPNISGNKLEDTLKPRICVAYGLLMQSRSHFNNLLQRLLTILLTDGGVSKKCLERLNKIGISSSQTTKLRLLDQLGGHFSQKLIDCVKAGKTLRCTGDNLDMTIRAHDMTSDHQNRDIHYFATNMIVNRLNFADLSHADPKQDLRRFSPGKFLLSSKDREMLRSNYMVLVGRILNKFLGCFKFLKSVLPKHIPHPHSKEMAEKSTIVSMPVLFHSEKEYSDVVLILRQYEKWIANIHTEAGIISRKPIEEQEIGELIGMVDGKESSPDQPLAHVYRDDPDDPLRGIKVPVEGDQLTRVRLAGARDLVAGNHTASQRFDHTTPYRCALWHTKASFLQYCYTLLYDSASVCEIGTLKCFRERYNRKNVTPDKVSKSYDGCEQFFVSVGTAYIVTAALDFWGLGSLDAKPTKNMPPDNITRKAASEQKAYYEETIGKFVDTYALNDPDAQLIQCYESIKEQREEITKEHHYLPHNSARADNLTSLKEMQERMPRLDKDFVRNYSLQMVSLTLTILQLKDTASEGDGERASVNEKLLLSFFKASNNYSKYAYEMFLSILQKEALLSQKDAAELQWGKFVNWRGGQGHNIENDLAQGICINLTKNLIKALGPNKTEKAISVISKAVPAIREIGENFDRLTSIHAKSSTHAKTSAQEDEMKMIKDLQKIKPFMFSPGRHHPSFPGINADQRSTLDMQKFNQWLKEHLRKMSRH